jgi:protocatechuate 3,4-dioxygenase, beta subunit
MRTTVGLWCLVAVSTAIAGEPISGLRPGDEVSAWEPIHVAGPHVGTKTCPVCTYLDAPILLAFAKNVEAAEKLAKPLEDIAAAHRLGKLKVMLVVVDGSDEQIRKLAKDSAIQAVMLVRPDPERKERQLKAYKIDAAVPNTVMLYQEYTVKNTWTGVKTADLADVKTATDKFLPKR